MKPLKIGTPVPTPREAVLAPYFREMQRHALLSPQEEVQLARRIQGGDHAARDLLVQANLRFVVSVAKRYVGLGLPISDLVSEGNVGLIAAAERFDPTRGFRFISFAVWWIRKSILKALEDTARTIRVPGNQARLRDQWIRAQGNAETGHGKGGSAEQPPAVDPAHMAALLNIHGPMLSLDEAHSPEGQALHERVAAPDAGSDAPAQEDSVKRTTERMLQQLPPRDRKVLEQYYGIGGHASRTLDNIGQELNCSRERVRQIKARALAYLRQPGRCPLTLEDLA